MSDSLQWLVSLVGLPLAARKLCLWPWLMARELQHPPPTATFLRFTRLLAPCGNSAGAPSWSALAWCPFVPCMYHLICERAALSMCRYTEFSVEGAAPIHLTGYYMPEYEMGARAQCYM